MENKKKEDIKELEFTSAFIPECCKSDDAKNCKHIAKKFKPKKRNIGL